MVEKLVTIARFANATMAHLAGAALAAAEIEHFIADEHTGPLFTGFQSGGIKLQVREADEERAQDVLSEQAEEV